jgi:hypothetical protein
MNVCWSNFLKLIDTPPNVLFDFVVPVRAPTP